MIEILKEDNRSGHWPNHRFYYTKQLIQLQKGDAYLLAKGINSLRKHIN